MKTNTTMIATLYKRRADGAIQVLTYIQEGCLYRTVTGILGGAQTSSEWTEALPKNEGKVNETTAEEQATREVDAHIKKKIEQHGYTFNIEEIDKPTFFKVMLAKTADFDRIKEHLDTTHYLYVQPKLDGMRCIASKNGLMSRAGKKIVSCPHIEAALKPYFDKNPNMVLDGELYNHELNKSFDKLMSLCRKTKTLDPESEKLVQYHVYDCIDNRNPKWSFTDRWASLTTDSPDLYTEQGEHCIHLVDTRVVQLRYRVELNAAMERLIDIVASNLDKGYEGTMVRYDVPYQTGKRNWNLQKIKKFTDEEFTILGFEEGLGNASDLAVKAIIKTKHGTICYPTMTGTVEYRQTVWNNVAAFTDKIATIKHFGYTKDGSLRHPIVKYIHTEDRDDI